VLLIVVPGHAFKVSLDLIWHIVFLPFQLLRNVANQDADTLRKFRAIVAILADFLQDASHQSVATTG
jgi:hypothetical protein